jgi:hypothetical protein
MHEPTRVCANKGERTHARAHVCCHSPLSCPLCLGETDTDRRANARTDDRDCARTYARNASGSAAFRLYGGFEIVLTMLQHLRGGIPDANAALLVARALSLLSGKRGRERTQGGFYAAQGGGLTAAILSLCAMLSAHVHMYSSIATLYACTDVVATTSPCPMLSAPTLVLR